MHSQSLLSPPRRPKLEVLFKMLAHISITNIFQASVFFWDSIDLFRAAQFYHYFDLLYFLFTFCHFELYLKLSHGA